MKSKATYLALGIALQTSAYAVFPFTLDSWTGTNGTIDTTITPDYTNNGNVEDADTLAAGFTSGTLNATSTSQGRLFGATPAERTLSYSIAYQINGGGTADLNLLDSSDGDNGTNAYNFFQLTNFQGTVTSINVVITLSEYVAGRNFSPTNIGGTPLVSSFAVFDPGTGKDRNDISATTSFQDVRSDLNGDGNFTPGTAGTAFNNSIYGTNTSGETSFTASSWGGGSGFKHVRGWDTDSDGTNDYEDVYVKGQTWTLSNSNGFTTDTNLIMSLDGQQYSNLESVPEPSTALLSLGALGLLLRRKRA